MYGVAGCAQRPANFGFEIQSSTDSMPQYWQAVGTDYKAFSDSNLKHHESFGVYKSISKNGEFGSLINHFQINTTVSIGVIFIYNTVLQE